MVAILSWKKSVSESQSSCEGVVMFSGAEGQEYSFTMLKGSLQWLVLASMRLASAVFLVDLRVWWYVLRADGR